MKHRILELDALRGIAALLVVLFHYTFSHNQAGFVFTFGVTGVDLFFIISGFVIFLTLVKASGPRHFILSRCTRLYPTYWTCVTITAFLFLFVDWTGITQFPDLATGYLGNLTMFQHYLGVDDLDDSYWTMIVEMLFYLLMLLIFWVKDLKSVEKIGYLLIIFTGFYDFVLEQHLPAVYDAINHSFRLINHFPLFFAGILFFKIKFEAPRRERYWGLLVCYVMTLLLFDNRGETQKIISLELYIVATTIYFSIMLAYLQGWLTFLVSKVTLFFGTISYCLYLIHQALGTRIIIPGLMEYLGFSFWPSAGVAFLFSAGIATFVTFYVEKPAIKFLRGALLKNNKVADPDRELMESPAPQLDKVES